MPCDSASGGLDKTGFGMSGIKNLSSLDSGGIYVCKYAGCDLSVHRIDIILF